MANMETSRPFKRRMLRGGGLIVLELPGAGFRFYKACFVSTVDTLQQHTGRLEFLNDGSSNPSLPGVRSGYPYGIQD